MYDLRTWLALDSSWFVVHLHEVEDEPGGHALPHDVDAEVGQRLQRNKTL